MIFFISRESLNSLKFTSITSIMGVQQDFTDKHQNRSILFFFMRAQKKKNSTVNCYVFSIQVITAHAFSITE